MADMGKIPGTPAFISSHGGNAGKKENTQAADAAKAKAAVKEDTKYAGGGEGSKG